VRYVCSDGDPGYNKRHHEFFKKWYLALLHGGLSAALSAIDAEAMMPVSDFLHMWKDFCNKVKNHPLTICPEMPDELITCEDLESLLGLGGTLSDKTSIGRMRDSHPLQLFSLVNCARCAEQGEHLALLYLLPWALQEEVIRNPLLTREERLEKAVLNFHLLLHYFDLSFLPRSEGINQRFRKKDTVAVTFAEDSVWPRILNNGLILIHFIIIAPATWSFSRFGTHCLENFFGFVRPNARADDRTVTATRLIARTTQVAIEMHDLGIDVVHKGRDNVGGVVIGGAPVELPGTVIDWAREHCEAIAALAGLSFDDADPVIDEDGVIDLICGWWATDKHHDNDIVYKKNFTKSPANAKIAARNAQAGARDE
jgi:hypothetical protein